MIQERIRVGYCGEIKGFSLPESIKAHDRRERRAVMKDYDNSKFYYSRAWKKVSRAYMTSRNYICERCGRPATICHHKTYLNGVNVHDPEVALNFDNLEALCANCHNIEHFSESRTKFDSLGNIISVRKTEEEKQFETARQNIDELLRKKNLVF